MKIAIIGGISIKRKKSTTITFVYVIQTEEVYDYYFKPEGILFIDDQGHHTLYCSDVRHNFLRHVIQKFPFKSLEEGISYRDHFIKIKDITDSMVQKFGVDLSMMKQVLYDLHQLSPRQYDFLKRFLNESASE